MRAPNVMQANLSVPANTVPELIAYAKENPGKINVATVSGTTLYVAGELFKMMTGVNLLQVPYRGTAAAMIDLLSGEMQLMFDTMPASIEHIRAGKLRPLAVTTAMRSDALPNIPTVGDFVPGYEASTWYGVGAPKNTPAEIIEKLSIKSTRLLPIPSSRRVWATWAEPHWLAHPLSSASSSPRTPKSGAQWSSSPAPNQIDPRPTFRKTVPRITRYVPGCWVI
jgi:tripartite-type tricarboxylate transporter receptor subunit TctC